MAAPTTTPASANAWTAAPKSSEPSTSAPSTTSSRPSPPPSSPVRPKPPAWPLRRRRRPLRPSPAIGLVELIDAQVPKRDQGLSVGQYLLLAAINRAAHPTSKAQAGPLVPPDRPAPPPARHAPTNSPAKPSGTTWTRSAEADIEAIEQDLSQRLVRQLQPDPAHAGLRRHQFLHLHQHQHPGPPCRPRPQQAETRRSAPGQPGHAGQHRLPCPALPPGLHRQRHRRHRLPDASPRSWRARYRQLAQGCEHITLIFDKGNNSAEAFETVDDSPFHFVGSLVPTQHPDLLGVPLDQFPPLAGARLAELPGLPHPQDGLRPRADDRHHLSTRTSWKGNCRASSASLEQGAAQADAICKPSLRRRRRGPGQGRGARPRPNRSASKSSRSSADSSSSSLIHLRGGARARCPP